MEIQNLANGCQNVARSLKIFLATLLAILLQGVQRGREPPVRARQSTSVGICLHNSAGARKYLNIAERRRFARAAREAPARIGLFCLLLMQTGGRISELLALTPAAIDLEDGVAILKTLKRRTRNAIRQVPVPSFVLRELDREFAIRKSQRDPALAAIPLWNWNRSTGWRYVKALMAAANIHGTAAMPKGLRHTFGVSAFQARVPPHLVQRWLGHASLRTTAIYGDVIGREQREFAARMWRDF
jgi:integrase/recombinase XerD